MSRHPFLLLVGLAALGCGRKASPEECNKMLDRYVDMTIEAGETQNLNEAQIAAIREMKKAIRKAEPAYSKVAARCERELPRRAYDCAMKAENANEWEACVQE
jgi:hypothetical protein